MPSPPITIMSSSKDTAARFKNIEDLKCLDILAIEYYYKVRNSINGKKKVVLWLSPR